MRPGMRLGGRYRLTARLAFGGMGEVWSGVDEVLGRAVAVKILRPELARDDAFRRRFREEARTAGGLSHPGIAAVYDYGEGAPSPPATSRGGQDGLVGSGDQSPGDPRPGRSGSGGNGVGDSGGNYLGQGDHGPHEPDWTSGDDVAYLVMELVPGKPLSAILAESGPLQSVRTLELVAQAARALHAAHQRGVVHRDVKPANLMVTPEGRVKVTDFGIARPQDHEPLTATGQVMGTAHYLAPELARGHLATALSDVYALGVVAYECVAGHRPFEGDNQVAVATAHLSETPPPLPDLLPPDVRRVIMTAMQKEPGHRFTTADAFAEVLDLVRFRLLADDPPPVWATRGPVPGVGAVTSRVPDDDSRTTVGVGPAGFLSEIDATRGVDGPGRPQPLGDRPTSDTAALPLGRYGSWAGDPGTGRPRQGRRGRSALPVVVALGLLAILTALLIVRYALLNGSRTPATGSGATTPAVTSSPAGERTTPDVPTSSPTGRSFDPGPYPHRYTSFTTAAQPRTPTTSETGSSVTVPPPTSRTSVPTSSRPPSPTPTGSATPTATSTP
jgi:serine/threonine protein kinase